MPTIRIVDDNVIEFIDSNGDVAAREEYNESTNQLDFVDEAGAPLPVKLGDVDAQGVSSATAPTDGTDVARKTEIDSKADLTAPDGVVVNSQVPDLAISNTTTVADETERLALTDVQEGDLAVQQDTDEGYIFLGGDPSVAANWSLLSNFDPVAAIDGADISPNSVTAASGTYSGTFTVNDLIANTLDADTLASPLDANTKDITNVGAFSSDSVNTDDSVTVTTGEASNTLHYGSNQDRANAGDNSVALGIGARANGDDGAGGSINSHVAVGYQAAQNNTGNRVTASGYQAARDNTGNNVTATGRQAARDNTGNNVTATGRQAAENNTGNNVTASGYRAARDNTGGSVTASGRAAARGDGLADPTTMGDDNIGIGVSAIRNNQASGLIAIGQEAGINAQTDDQLIITDRNGNRRMTMDLTNGNLNIDGTLTENATL